MQVYLATDFAKRSNRVRSTKHTNSTCWLMKIRKSIRLSVGWLVCWCQRGSVPKGQAQWVSSFAPMKLPPGVEIRNDKRWSDCLWPAHVIRNGGGVRHLSNKGLCKILSAFLSASVEQMQLNWSFLMQQNHQFIKHKCLCTFKFLCVWTYTCILYLNIHIHIHIYICMYAHIKYASPQFYILQCLV